MDVVDLRSISVVLCAIAIVGIGWWAFSPRRKKDFDEAANLPFADESEQETATDADTDTDSKDEHTASKGDKE